MHTDSDHDSSALVRRRTLTRTAAWAVPVLTTVAAAPAYATSGGCTQRGAGTMTTGTVSKHPNVVTGLVFPGNVTASISISQVRAGKAIDPLSDAETGRIFTTDYGTPWSYVRLHHAKGMKKGDTLTMTITFTQPVRNFGFTITDIDGSPDSWIDQVSVSPESFSIAGRGSNLTGAGTTASPFLSDPQNPGNIDSPAGDAAVVWPGALTTFTVLYTAADSGNASAIGQMIGLGRFSFDNCL